MENVYGNVFKKSCFYIERGFQFAEKTQMKIKDFLEHLNVKET
jgi:hypothetical protein